MLAAHHHHDHSHASPTSVLAPRSSLFRLSLAERLGLVAAVILALWSTVWWALA